MSNPALSNNPALSGKTLTAEELRRIYDQPAADLQRPGVDAPAAAPAGVPPVVGSDRPMTYENTISKTVIMFLIVLAFGVVGWFVPILAIPAAIVGLVLGLVNAFKKQPSVPLILLYAAFQGVFLGGISGIFEAQWAGIVSQAVIGTLAVFGVTLLLFRSGKVRTSPKMTKIVLIAMAGYLVFSLVNLGRHLKLDSEGTAHKAIDGFIERFGFIEDKAEAEGKQLAELTPDEMNELWEEVKRERG